MWSRLILMCCSCFLLTGVSSCQKKGGITIDKTDFVVKQISEKRVFFDYDKSNINEVGAGVLLDVIEVLQNNPDIKVTVIGHTDNRGSYEYNVALGERRADTAKKFMVNCAPYLENRIKTASRGETEPIVYVQDDSKNSKYERQHAKNRRVEFLFSKINK
ncbi:OmpA family protein [Wolbachia endosymbiont of Cruorifilaria tuberocauda]|uniref:OmpA family protein n=1 Tax=Wolbachia endosymbiont of Cruorifilaria tuberocauda TaxID=1812111 RepID=UPI00158B701E|nr:OmpA family protein [Wolbachia endosymbiont of Cruorifilaria tuberocauda]QKX01395.1 OmpA family protein [Wolbachia endosymbiont of Cruorifilaria tuberocauda]